MTAIAFGRKPEAEYHNNLHLLSKDLKGNCCCLYSSLEKEDVQKYVQISKKNGIDLDLVSYWNKAGDYVNYKRNAMKKNVMEE